MAYKDFIEDNFRIINKDQAVVPFKLNAIQYKYMSQDSTGRDIILKARQQGFSSVILARFTADFILKENSYSVVIADNSDNATGLLERVKFLIQSYEEINGIKVPLKYNSKYELHNGETNAKYIIGTAENKEVARSKTITNLHLSEAAFYPDLEKLKASAMQAVVPNGYVAIETTANGFNYFKEFWSSSELGETGFKPLFYKASDFYSQEFLDQKKMELGRLYSQEYPETPEEAFLTSGDCFFDTDMLRNYLSTVKEPMKGIYA